jgi:hypothetical protein
MTFRTSREEIKAIRTTRDRAASLLNHYPRLSRDETGEVLHFLKTARHLDVGLLSADDAIRPRLDAFMEDHKKDLSASGGEAGWVAGMILAFLMLCWLVWEAGAAYLG